MSILQKQATAESIEQLAAQRNLYSRAKNYMGLQFLLAVPVALAMVVAMMAKPELRNTLAPLGFAILVLEVIVLTPKVKALRAQAAGIQELFDTQVLALDWNESATGKKPDREEVQKEAQKHGLNPKQTASLQGWYTAAVGEVPQEFGVIISQRSNLYWDADLRRKFARAIKTILWVVALGLLGNGIKENMQLLDFLARFVAPLASTYFVGYRQWVEHTEAADRLDKLKDTTEKIWAEAIKGADAKTLKQKCRTLQDQIYDHRKKSPPVFDFIFKWFKKGSEHITGKVAAELVAEVKARPASTL